MDRWGYLDKWKEYEQKRTRLVPGWVEACILGVVVASLLGGRLLHCLIGFGPLGSCMEAGMPRVLAMSRHSAALLLGIWVGPRIGFRLDSKGLGWVFGMALIVGISAVLVWIGFPIASP